MQEAPLALASSRPRFAPGTANGPASGDPRSLEHSWVWPDRKQFSLGLGFRNMGLLAVRRLRPCVTTFLALGSFIVKWIYSQFGKTFTQ